jgi:23S rRNA pseudouridine1911/1915/1917 synthase
MACMTQEREFTLATGDERLDKLLADHLPELSRAQIQALIKDGNITVDGKAAKPGHKPRGGEVIHVTLPDVVTYTIEPENIPLNVLYEDADLAVIDKPAGLVVHPGAGNPTGTLVNALLARYPDMQQMAAALEDEEDEEQLARVGIVHRLDKDTSGLIVVARHTDALTALMEQFRERTVEKTYLAMTERTPKTLTGTIDAPIGRDPQQRQRMNVIARGRAAVTEYTVLDNQFKGGQAFVQCKPRTGRTHQIRVHLAFIGCPIVGDTVYGSRRKYPDFDRHFLHAAGLVIDHPRTGKRLTFESPLPDDLKTIQAWLKG